MPEKESPILDQRVIELYDEYTHRPLERRVFMQRLAQLVGGAAAASVLLPFLENNYARAAIVEPNDRRLETGYLSYPGASGNVRAYFAKPLKAPAKLPMVLVVHENRGLNPHIEDVARRAAIEGYFAMAPDVLSALGGTPPDEEAARQLFTKLTRPVAMGDLLPAIDYLAARPDSNGKVGAVGFCWGGGMVNRLAASSPKLVAAVPYYGEVPDAADVPKIRARLLLHYASLDSRINAGIPSYEAALKAAGVPYTLHMYEGANHAFNNDTGGARYDKKSADLAWQRTLAFLKQHLT